MSSITRPVANRAIHLRITPRPSSLGESREMMRLLSGFGEIEYFKNLRYDALTHPNAALVIYKDEQAAKDCLKRTPIRFRMGRASAPRLEQSEEEVGGGMARKGASRKQVEEVKEAPKGPVGAPFGMGGAPKHSRSMSTSVGRAGQGYSPFYGSEPDNPSARPAPSVNTRPIDDFPSRNTGPDGSSSQTAQKPKQPLFHDSISDPNARIFQINANPSFRNFRDLINVGPYHGGFKLDTKQFGQMEMVKKVPLPGLSNMNWKAEDRPWHVVRTEKDRERSGVMKRKSLGEVWKDAHGGG